MKIIIKPKQESWKEILKRPAKSKKDLTAIVEQVFKEIKENGDDALKKYTHFFDKVDIDNFKVEIIDIKNVASKIPQDLKEAILLAKNNIEKFHQSQILKSEIIETTEGVTCWQESRPIEKIGLYIPGGTAPLFSTVLMLGIPAVLAKCKDIILCTPPNKDGEIDPAILYTANLIGIDKIYSIGGIQAIGALTFGTESIPKVYKIFGPGNQYVTVAKQVAFNNGIAIDMPAGPSELLVVADETAKANFVAADLLSQAEHGVDSQVICISNNRGLLSKIEEEIKIQIENLPRKGIAEKAMNNSKLIYLEKQQEIIDLINEYAPEHLILSIKDKEIYAKKIINAGSVFLGNYATESAGDYASGTNHTLPTNGFAKAYSGVNLDAFTKKITFQKITKKGLQNIGKAIELMAEAEGLQAHKNAVSIRLKNL